MIIIIIREFHGLEIINRMVDSFGVASVQARNDNAVFGRKNISNLFSINIRLSKKKAIYSILLNNLLKFYFLPY